MSEPTEGVDVRRLREDLLAAVSHDMQTPLAAIVGLADILAEDPNIPDEERGEICITLSRQAHILRALVQQFLDFSRLEEDRHLILNRTAVDVVEVVDLVADRFRHARKIHVGAPANLPRAFADPDRVEQVLSNLVSNAVKYSHDAVVVSARDRDGEILVDVVDSGDGFEESEIERLFDKFQRGRNAEGVPGTGLGLYVSRAICEAHGGSLTCESSPGIGSRFRMTLPAVDADEVNSDKATGE
jgi:two-component system, OmpR family, sensor histidine kinase KdpD